MAYEFRLQDPGEGIHEAEIIEIKVSTGDRVAEGDNVLVAETDKAAVDIPTPVTGEVSRIMVSEGDTVEVGNVLMVLETEGTADDSGTKEEDGEDDSIAREEKDEKKKQEAESGSSSAETDQGQEKEENEEAQRDEEVGEEPRSEDGERTGREEPEDRPRDEDRSERERGTDKKNTDQSAHRKSGGNENQEEDVLATPAVRGLARELDVDLGSVSGSGTDGRVLEEDVRKAAGSEGAPESETGAYTSPAASGDESERIKLRSIRRSTAKRMAQAWREIPHAIHHDAIDITAMERTRREHAPEVEESGAKLTLTPFIIKALAGALHEHPRFNARFDKENEEIELFHAVHIGVAFDTERGLLVPVVRDVQRKTVFELASEIVAISQRLKEERADQAMLRGGTITLTNVGGLGGTGFSPIINPPQVAIVGTARAELRPVVEGDLDRATSETRLVLPICVAFDHRVNDGADAARFMNHIKLLLSDPEQLALRS